MDHRGGDGRPQEDVSDEKRSRADSTDRTRIVNNVLQILSFVEPAPDWISSKLWTIKTVLRCAVKSFMTTRMVEFFTIRWKNLGAVTDQKYASKIFGAFRSESLSSSGNSIKGWKLLEREMRDKEMKDPRLELKGPGRLFGPQGSYPVLTLTYFLEDASLWRAQRAQNWFQPTDNSKVPDMFSLKGSKWKL